MYGIGRLKTSKAFALPTVLIASVVLLMILAVSVTATATVRTTLKNQYYTQLAQVAGESGTAYAKACLAANGNIPQWTDAKPLTPATNCSGDVILSSGASCPSDPKCSVTINGNVRSSFSVPKPTVDASGYAVTIPNTGYVNVLRTSNGAVWRTYKQPSVQNAVVPDLCSGNATAARGWSSAVMSSTQDALPSASTADSITLASGALPVGAMYFRKDFNVSDPGSYDLNVLTNTVNDLAETSIDKNLISTSNGSLATNSVTLTSGCHTLLVRLTNQAALPRATDFTLSLTKSGASTPIVVSNTAWRVSASDPVHFSSSNFDESPISWDQVLVAGNWNNATLPWGSTLVSNWQTVSGDAYTSWITTKVSADSTLLNRPYTSYAWFRQTQPFTLSTAASVRISDYCDDSCVIYLDGQQVQSSDSSGGAGVISKTITIQAGTHTFGVRLYNNLSGTNSPSAFLFAAYNLATKTTIARSDAGWDSTNFWNGSAVEPYSYDTTFFPTPYDTGTTNVKALVVGGGGAGGGGWEGGGGGGGGVIYDAAHPVSVGTYTVIVGAGGAGGGYGSTNSGGSSLFDTIRAAGGGYGAGEPNGGTVIYPAAGGSGGGGSHPYTSVLTVGVAGQGNGGGTGITGNPYVGAGGGGAGASGQSATTAKAGDGGAGVSNSITGSAVTYGGGGGGAFRAGTNGAGGAGGGGAGSSTTGNSGVVFSGGGGGAAGNGNATGISGSGGSGVVIISFPTSAMTASASGNYIDYSGQTPGYTTYFFRGNGALTITSIP